ncbi:hypothetical protein AVEN_120199-1 [Araneus ventricosus]|uniref:Reverse transcriptase domain-containing protein n=1 Tax=Araneus ventricosus TaxID=182803 RepID=A0A4Y2ULQ5_ARAVE|nr:hypothetical protein AVEN_120199-1 [Araneus ventricosus]
MKHFFPNNDSYIGDIYTPSVESVEEVNYKEIDLVIYNLKKNVIQNSEEAKIFFLQKSGKDPKSCDAYRPVCLLPTIGKILERVFQNRFNKYLSLNNIIHRNQKGFRERTGCDRALYNIVNKIRETRSNRHCALISLDIKAAFDNMDWSVLFKIFDFYKIPPFYRNFIYYYLLGRKVVFKDETLEIERDCHKGCPQGSVVVPNLWNIYVNKSPRDKQKKGVFTSIC